MRLKTWHVLVLAGFTYALWRAYAPRPDPDGTAPAGAAQSLSNALGGAAGVVGLDEAAGLSDTISDNDDLGTTADGAAADGDDSSLGGDDGGIGSYLG